jgi:glycyl-tRNA synthetase beta chain
LEETAGQVMDFFRHRMQQILIDRGIPRDLVAAVVAASVDDLPAVVKRAEALLALKAKPDFEPLATAFKRVVNIITKATHEGLIAPSGGTVGAVDPTLFAEDCESSLYGALQDVRGHVVADIQDRAFERAFLAVATLKEPIDRFFDGVMVLTEDRETRQNRLALLKEISDLFARFADFSKIST